MSIYELKYFSTVIFLGGLWYAYFRVFPFVVKIFVIFTIILVFALDSTHCDLIIHWIYNMTNKKFSTWPNLSFYPINKSCLSKCP